MNLESREGKSEVVYVRNSNSSLGLHLTPVKCWPYIMTTMLRLVGRRVNLGTTYNIIYEPWHGICCYIQHKTWLSTGWLNEWIKWWLNENNTATMAELYYTSFRTYPQDHLTLWDKVQVDITGQMYTGMVFWCSLYSCAYVSLIGKFIGGSRFIVELVGHCTSLCTLVTNAHFLYRTWNDFEMETGYTGICMW